MIVPIAKNTALPLGNIVIYTANAGGYDIVLPPRQVTPGAKFVCFTDDPEKMVNGWEMRPFPREVSTRAPTTQCRYCKVMVTRLFPDADLSVWLDANILVKRDLSPLLEEFLNSGADMACVHHPDSRTTTQEIDFMLSGHGRLAKSSYKAAMELREEYIAAGIGDWKIPVTGILFRDHRSDRMRKAMKVWWDKMDGSGVMRDQFSIGHAVTSTELRIHWWDWQYFQSATEYFRFYFHAGKGSLARLHRKSEVLKDYSALHAVVFTVTSWIKTGRNLARGWRRDKGAGARRTGSVP